MGIVKEHSEKVPILKSTGTQNLETIPKDHDISGMVKKHMYSVIKCIN